MAEKERIERSKKNITNQEADRKKHRDRRNNAVMEEFFKRIL